MAGQADCLTVFAKSSVYLLLFFFFLKLLLLQPLKRLLLKSLVNGCVHCLLYSHQICLMHFEVIDSRASA